MGIFDETHINWFEGATFDRLATINEFYSALLGLWLLDEIDPTNGKAWKLIDESILKVQQNYPTFANAKKMVTVLYNPQSINPIHQLWREMAGHPTIVI